MTTSHKLGECPADLLARAADLARVDEKAGLTRIEALLQDHGLDPRLHFLRGSLLAGRGDIANAHEAMRLAVAIAPNYELARYQLGFLELTSGDVIAASETWRPLLALPADAWMRLFVEGLTLLARDDFDEAVALLKAGMARNGDYSAINADVRLLIDAIDARHAQPVAASPPSRQLRVEPLSAAHLLLQQYAAKPTKH